jgi:hypothetical protein
MFRCRSDRHANAGFFDPLPYRMRDHALNPIAGSISATTAKTGAAAAYFPIRHGADP